MKKIIDLYLTKPLVADMAIICLIVACILVSEKYLSLEFPGLDKIKGLSNEVGGASITIAGFILTILALLITFKQDYKEVDNKQTSLSVFFNSPLYFKAVKIYKDSVIVLIVVFVLLLTLQFFELKKIEVIFKYISLSALLVSSLTFFRCVFVLSLVIKLQENKK